MLARIKWWLRYGRWTPDQQLSHKEIQEARARRELIRLQLDIIKRAAQRGIDADDG